MFSHVGAEIYNSATDTYEVDSFVLRSPSEHIVMGKYLDMELQIKHNAREWNDTYSIKYGYVSIFFSVEDYDKSITFEQNETVRDFMRHLKFDDKGQPEVDLISFGRLMDLDIVDFNDRWTYLGSETFPPCEQYVYWNVLARVLPIEVQTFAKFRAIMDARKEELGGSGNNRMIQHINDHGIRFVGAMRGAVVSGLVLASAIFYGQI